MNSKIQSTTYLFFIDDSGTKSKDNYILIGGFLISAGEYILLSKEIKKINSKYNWYKIISMEILNYDGNNIKNIPFTSNIK